MSPWQTATEAGRIINIAKADENTVAPLTRPLTGTAFDWTKTASGEEAFGWTVADFKFTEDNFDFTDNEGSPIIVEPPTVEKKVGIIRDKPPTPEQVQFTSYEIGAKVLAWSSNVSIDASGVHTFVATYPSRNAVIIEVQGLGMHYFPSVEIVPVTASGGVKSLGKQAAIMEIFAGDVITSGYTWIHYLDS